MPARAQTHDAPSGDAQGSALRAKPLPGAGGNSQPHPFVDVLPHRAAQVRQLAQALRLALAVALVLSLLLVASTAALLSRLARPRQVPFLVEVDETGRVEVQGPATHLPEPTDAIRRWVLQSWITQVRTVTSDARHQRRLLEEAGAFTAGKAVGLLEGHLARRSPYDLARRRTVEVQVTSVVPVEEDRSTWQVDWTETHRGATGAVVATERWRAVVWLAQVPPREPDLDRVNPLHLVVTHFTFHQIVHPIAE